MSDIVFRHAATSYAARCYHGEDWKTHCRIPRSFLALEIDGQIIGFINCGCATRLLCSMRTLNSPWDTCPLVPM